MVSQTRCFQHKRKSRPSALLRWCNPCPNLECCWCFWSFFLWLRLLSITRRHNYPVIIVNSLPACFCTVALHLTKFSVALCSQTSESDTASVTHRTFCPCNSLLLCRLRNHSKCSKWATCERVFYDIATESGCIIKLRLDSKSHSSLQP